MNIMADVANLTGAAAAPAEKKKPERPDEAVYKKELAAAQKAHEAAKAKFVSRVPAFAMAHASKSTNRISGQLNTNLYNRMPFALSWTMPRRRTRTLLKQNAELNYSPN